MAQITFSVTDEIKECVDSFAMSRGFKKVGTVARVALYEYFRRKTGKDIVTEASVHRQAK